MPDDFKIVPGQVAAEQKYDGHRILTQVTLGKQVGAWNRLCNAHALPDQIVHVLKQFPVGSVYDGALCIPGGVSTDVVTIGSESQLVYVVFDVLRLLGARMTDQSYDQRRAYLKVIFAKHGKSSPSVILADSVNLSSYRDLTAMEDRVWERGGEGLIIKRRSSAYYPGKRCEAFLKIKLGFEAH